MSQEDNSESIDTETIDTEGIDTDDIDTEVDSGYDEPGTDEQDDEPYGPDRDYDPHHPGHAPHPRHRSTGFNHQLNVRMRYFGRHPLRSFLHIAPGVFIQWLVLGLVVGILAGLVGTIFSRLLILVTGLFSTYKWLLYGLPIAGLIIAWMYKTFWPDHPGDTNMVIASIYSEDNIPLKMTPLIAISTILTHLCGGSAGREGAALQIGGSIGDFVGHKLHLTEHSRNVLIMCGMAAAFSALFGTPVAAAVFALEVISVGIMHYSALFPCIIASVTARYLAELCGVHAEGYEVVGIPAIDPIVIVKILILGICCGILSAVFCRILHVSGDLAKKYLKNPYIRALVGSGIIIGLTLLVGARDYNGAGASIIEAAVGGHVIWYAFILKMIFTAVTLSTGYKGGEIVPTLFAGATFGCLLGSIMGLSPSLCAAVGMVAMFCGVTNCPIASLILSVELFGSGGFIFYIIGIATSYLMSGYHSLYHSQRIMYSKYETKFINRNAK